MKIFALKGSLILAAAVLAISAVPQAQATTVTFGGSAPTADGVFSTVPGATTVDFNSGSVPAWYTNSGDAAVVNGSTTNVYRTPTGDTSDFLTTGSTTGGGNVHIDATSFSSKVNYFGLYWGSNDTYNTIVFSLSDGSTQTFTGSDVAALSSGVFPTDGKASAYVNFFADAGLYFTGIDLFSNGYAFESDNHAFGSAAPEPGTLSLLGGAALALGVGLFRRRRSSK